MNYLQSVQNFLKKNIANVSLQFFVASFMLSALCFLLFWDNFQTFSATTTVLVNPKSEIALKQQKQIEANLIGLTHTLAFYDRMLELNKDLQDKTAGRGQDERKQLWNNIISVKENSQNDSLIVISVSAQDAQSSEKLNSKTVRTLFDVASKHWDVKNDLDLRIVDGPLVSKSFPFWYVFLLLSVLIGSAIALLIQNGINLLEQYVVSSAVKTFSVGKKSSVSSAQTDTREQEAAQRKANESKPDSFTQMREHTQKSSDEDFAALNRIIEQDLYPNYPEMPVRPAQTKASAPDNLPIADEEEYFAEQNFATPESFPQEEVPVQSAEIQEAPKPEQPKGEPTPEELKQRLNQLLRGEL